jgi:hypothetical protein
MDKLNIKIILFSPFGNTLRIGKTIQREIIKLGHYCEIINLTRKNWGEILDFDYSIIDKADLLIFGSGVYAWNIVEPIKIIIKKLPTKLKKKTAIFITYGLISGYPLWEATRMLKKRQSEVIGCLKVAAKHSMIFQDEEDIYLNRPNENDLRVVQKFARVLIKRKLLNSNRILSLRILDYNSIKIKLIYFLLFKWVAMFLLPKTIFNKKKCLKCGLCVKNCPLKILKLSPFPTKTGKCIKCYNCMWSCPTGAVYSKTFSIFNLYHKLLAMFYHENPETKIYI